jgi:hypothetical protein
LTPALLGNREALLADEPQAATDSSDHWNMIDNQQ